MTSEEGIRLRRPATEEEENLYLEPLVEDALDRLGVEPGEEFELVTESGARVRLRRPEE
jgi:hypothetical protein